MATVTLIPAPPLGLLDADGRGRLPTTTASSDYVAADAGVHLGTGDGTFHSPPPGKLRFVRDRGSLPLGDRCRATSAAPAGLSWPSPAWPRTTSRSFRSTATARCASLQKIAVGLFPVAIAKSDLNSDGRIDLAVADFGSDDVTVLLNNGDGTFRKGRGGPGRRSQPIASAAGDFNGDGHADLAVADSLSDDVTILAGRGDGSFGFAGLVKVGRQPVAIVAGKFRGDGQTDLAVADFGVGCGHRRSAGSCSTAPTADSPPCRRSTLRW